MTDESIIVDLGINHLFLLRRMPLTPERIRPPPIFTRQDQYYGEPPRPRRSVLGPETAKGQISNHLLRRLSWPSLPCLSCVCAYKGDLMPRSFIHPFVRSFARSFIHSFISNL